MNFELTARRAYWDAKYLEYWRERTSATDARTSADCVPADVALIELYLDKLSIKPGETVLDVGIGFGRLVPAFHRRAAVVHGIDISPQMIAEARRRVAGDVRELSVQAIEELQYPDCAFDHVVCWAVFDACDQGEALKQMARVLKPGGRLLLSGKNHDYRDDDELGYVAEVNARAKGHPNFFTDHGKLMAAMTGLGLIVQHAFYFERRGDGSENRFEPSPPARFYEYTLVCAKQRHLTLDRRLDIAQPVSLTCLRRQAAFSSGEAPA